MTKARDILMKSIGKDLAVIPQDIGESLVDSVLKDGLLKDIPIVAWVVGFSKAGLTVRDRLFLNKILRFLKPLGEISLSDRRSFAEKLAKDENAQKRLESILLPTVEGLDDLQKAEILGRLFREYLRKQLSLKVFFRCCEVVGKSNLDDLREFVGNEANLEGYQCDALAAVGLYRLQTGFTSYDSPRSEYESSELGNLIKAALGPVLYPGKEWLNPEAMPLYPSLDL